ncbi:unnamed protein product [Calicophoron daubneyi]|uniref:RanBD1 domain-containing protein n=1 Tax=Calicophoron daubneyi TaxID=300641 RepID=A0AAV2TL87_CALDB
MAQKTSEENHVAQTVGESSPSTTSSMLFRPPVLHISSESAFTIKGASENSHSNPPSTSNDSIAVTTTCPTFATASPIIHSKSLSSNMRTESSTNGGISMPSGYVFGSNISSRVVNANTSHGASSGIWTVNADEASTSSSVFTALAKAVSVSKPTAASSKTETLEDSAQKVAEDQKNAALSLAQVDVFTGEEGELQIFRQHCRVYVFDPDKQKWSALGASHFHLNDVPADKCASNTPTGYRSRVVVRLASTRRVIINTPIWAEMPVALVDSRSLRIGAVSMEDGHLKSYLVTFPPDETAAKVHELLSFRKKNVAKGTSAKPILHSQPAVAGQKRPLDDSGGCFTKDVNNDQTVSPSVNPRFGSDSRSTLVTAQSQSGKSPKSNIFRPSVLSSCVHSSSAQFGTAISSPHTTIGSAIQFRQSALDPVVKRLREDQPSSESQSADPLPVHTDEKSGVPKSFNIPAEPSSVCRNLLTDTSHSADFMFGHNVSDRVVNAGPICDQSRAVTCSGFSCIIRDKPSSSKTLGLCTRSLDTPEETEVHDSDAICAPPCELTLQDSASAVAEEMRAKSAVPLSELPRTPTLTGEEGECLALKTYCQFYSFDREKHIWVERGKAYLHLNDIPSVSLAERPSESSFRISTGPPARSRLVARVCQTLKLLANTPVWPGMNVAMADERSIRITTISTSSGDDSISEKPKQAHSEGCEVEDNTHERSEFCAYLLVMRSPKEADRLYQALISRMNVLTNRQADADDQPESGAQITDCDQPCSKIPRISQPPSEQSQQPAKCVTSSTEDFA